VADLVEPLIERSCKILLAARRLIGEAPELARHLGEPELELARTAHRLEALGAALPLRAPGEHRGGDDEQQRKACADEKDMAQAESLAADLEQSLVEAHRVILRDSHLQIQNKNSVCHKDGRIRPDNFVREQIPARLLDFGDKDFLPHNAREFLSAK
jgi:hypothetical protein